MKFVTVRIVMNLTFTCVKRTVARVAFGIVIVIQCFFLAAYPATYENNSHWYVVTTTFAPAVIVWLCIVCFKVAKLRWLFHVWDLYIVCALIPNIAIIFGQVGDKLDKEKFLSPNALKAILCLTPPLLLLLLHTAEDSDQSENYKELVSKLSYHMAIDLFDVVDMISIALDEKGHGHGAFSNLAAEICKPYMCTCANTTQATLEQLADLSIPEGFGRGMVAIACFSLLLSTFQLAENKLSGDPAEESTIRFRTAVIRNVVEIAFVNFVFLIMRAVVFFKYGKDESIFMAKNIIGIIFSILDIHALCESHSTSFWSLCKSCFGLREL